MIEVKYGVKTIDLPYMIQVYDVSVPDRANPLLAFLLDRSRDLSP